MYAYIRGTLAGKTMTSAVIEAGGVGYEIFVDNQTLSQLPQEGREVKLYTHLNVREDAMQLYGFASMEDKTMFERMIAVSGIGPRVAINVLSSMTSAQLAIAIVSEDARSIAKVPGIGKKTAERLILELKGKIGESELTSSWGDSGSVPQAAAGSIQMEAIQALLALGYSSTQASQAVSQSQGDTVEELIFNALRRMDKV